MSIRVKLWTIATNLYPTVLRKVYKMDLGADVRIAHKAHLDKSVNPQGVHIGDRTWVLNERFFFSWSPKSVQMVTAAMKFKDAP